MGQIISTHKGITVIKVPRIQKLTKNFENLTMEDNESFNYFYDKLNDIINTSFNLGEKMCDSQAVGKILRSLQERFQPKVTTT